MSRYSAVRKKIANTPKYTANAANSAEPTIGVRT